MSLQKSERNSRLFSSTKSKIPSHSNSKQSKTSFILDEAITVPISETQLQKGVIIIYNFWLGPGNNSELIRKILLSRGNWNQVEDSQRIHFKWAQTVRGYKYDLLGCSGRKEMYNHFQHYSELNNKALLIRNLNQYCESQRINMFSFTPVTFIINLNDVFCDKILSDFLIFYTKHNPQTSDSKTRMEYLQTFKNFIKSHGHRFKPLTFKYSTYNMIRTFLDQKHNSYLWLLKPTDLNRGRGVRVFSDLDTLKKMLKEYTEGFYQKSLETSSNSKQQINYIKTQSFVVQKYIQKPMLINKRKFDIRNWALVDHNSNVYFFKQGYARMSSEQYNLSKNNIQNVFIHLTNNAIQQHAENYCKFQKGNQLSFRDIQDYIAKTYQKNDNYFYDNTFLKMKQIVQTVFRSVRGKLNRGSNKFCMEIFGFDFFLDEQLNVWVIQVNMNPCLQESSPLLGQLIPRMINDAFKLTVDVVFPKWVPLKEIPKTKIMEQKLPIPMDSKSRPSFRVENYSDEVNLWEYVCNIANK